MISAWLDKYVLLLSLLLLLYGRKLRFPKCKLRQKMIQKPNQLIVTPSLIDYYSRILNDPNMKLQETKKPKCSVNNCGFQKIYLIFDIFSPKLNTFLLFFNTSPPNIHSQIVLLSNKKLK